MLGAAADPCRPHSFVCRSADRDNTSLLNDATTAGEGRRSTDLRSVEFEVATGRSTRQFGYQREALVAINGRIPGTANDFGATARGRNIGAPCPFGQTLVPSRLYSFKVSGADAGRSRPDARLAPAGITVKASPITGGSETCRRSELSVLA